MLTQSPRNDFNSDVAHLDFNSYLRKKDKHRKVKKIETFLVDDVRCAIGISGRLFSTCRLYSMYPLMVETGSVFYRALVDDNPKEFFKYTTKVVTQRGIYYETVERLKKFHFKGSKGANDHLEKLKSDCREGKCIVTGKHYYQFSTLSMYCKADGGDTLDEKAQVLNQFQDFVEVRKLEDGEYQKVREAILKSFGKCLKADIDTMTACLDILPFSFKGTEPKFYFVDCTRFHMTWREWVEDHFVDHHSDAIKNCLFLFITNPDGKLRGIGDITHLSIPDLGLNYFGGTSWEDLPYNSKVLFKPIVSQTTIRESDKKTIKDYIAPGSVLRLDDENLAVCLANGEIMTVANKTEADTPNSAGSKSSGSGGTTEKLQTFIENNKDLKKIQVLVNPVQIRDFEEELGEVYDLDDMKQSMLQPSRLNSLNSLNISRKNSSNGLGTLNLSRQPSLNLNGNKPTYPVTGLTISLKAGALKKLTKKPSIMNLQF